MLEGRRLRPADALALGAVDAVVPRGQLIDAARAWVLAHPQAVQPWDAPGFRAPGAADFDWARAHAELIERTRGRYPAPLALLGAVRKGIDRPIEEGLRIESMYFAPLLPSAVARNLMRSGFVHRQLARRYAGEAGPYVQRLRAACEHEVAALLHEGATAAVVEQAALDADWTAMPCPARPWPARPCPTMPCPALGPAATASMHQPTLDAVTQRLLHAVALEGVRCFDDGSVESAAEADVGSLAGIGFPRWTGGVLSYVETVGLARFVFEAERLAQQHGTRFAPPPSLIERARSGSKFYGRPSA
jgi:hypothetical protein